MCNTRIKVTRRPTAEEIPERMREIPFNEELVGLELTAHTYGWVEYTDTQTGERITLIPWAPVVKITELVQALRAKNPESKASYWLKKRVGTKGTIILFPQCVEVISC